MTTRREELLDLAKEVTLKSRPSIYGTPLEIFTRHATMMNGLGYRRPNNELWLPADSSVCQLTWKIARLVYNPEYNDNWVDIAGYAACGYEVSRPDQLSGS